MTAVAVANPPQLPPQSGPPLGSLPRAGSGNSMQYANPATQQAVVAAQNAARLRQAQQAAHIANQGNISVTNNVVTWVNTSSTTGTAAPGLSIPVTSGTISSNGTIFTIHGGTAQHINSVMQNQMLQQINQSHANLLAMRGGNMVIDREMTLELPDGTIIEVKDDGSYAVVDADAKVKYKGNPLREFNRYINASDLLEEFVDFVGSVGGIDKQGFFDLPVELFIRWLVIRAAEADGDDAPEDEAVLKASLAPKALPAPAPKVWRNCKCCGKFVTKKKAEHGLFFCSTEHYERFSDKVMA